MLQVPRIHTESGKVFLESRIRSDYKEKLNEKFSDQASGASQFEELNFGVGAHGTDQAYLTYLKYVKKTQPDYVFLFFFDAHIWRTWSNTYCSNFGSNKNLCLKIRPFSEISAKGAEQIRIILQLEKFHRFISDLSFMKEARKRFPMIPSEYLNYISTHENLIDESGDISIFPHLESLINDNSSF